nr:GyrI-like domain-containing protein [uncultured Roseateles sp.]
MKPSDSNRAHSLAYAQRMNRVLDHIDRHLDQALDLPSLAEVAHFSAFHFHRLFAAWTGETLGDYLRRRRLEVAAVHLANHSRRPVLDVALAVGFGSGEAFARAFKLRFGCTPSAWREQTPQRWADQLEAVRAQAAQSNLDQADRKPGQATGGPLTHPEYSSNPELAMEVKLNTLPGTRVAYLRHTGPYGPSVGRFWAETFFPWRAAQGLGHAPCYGIGHDDPSVGDPAKFRYDACVEVPADFVAKSPAGIADLPGGRYAVAAFYGTGADIGLAWTEFLRDWLPASGLEPDGRPCFEYYPADGRYDPATGAFECQLCLPVRAR